MQDKNWNGEGLPPVGKNCFIVLNNSSESESEITPLWFGKHIFTFINCAGYEVSSIISGYTFKPIPNPKETAKQKAIDEIVNELFTINKIFKQENIAEFIYNRYTKSKVKPLSYEKYREIIQSDRSHESDYQTFIENGYCIGSAE